MLPCHVVIFVGPGGEKGRGFIVIIRREGEKQQKQEELLRGSIKNLPRELTIELLYLELPTYFSLLWYKKIDTLQKIPSH